VGRLLRSCLEFLEELNFKLRLPKLNELVEEKPLKLFRTGRTISILPDLGKVVKK
jgi:hypothetical protein